MPELDDLTPRWADWITQLGNSLDIDETLVDVAAIHRLTGEIAARFERPMAPVGALLMGFVLAANPGMKPEQASALIVASLPPSTGPQG